MYFNYHGKAQKLIRNGELDYYEIVASHGGISPCLVLHFKNNKPMPIRREKWSHYIDLIDKTKENS